jgi:ATP-dependent Clp protease ATP-binding subunit ClpC
VLAQFEARDLRFSHIGTEALLLGLLREREGVAARALKPVDVTLKRARREVALRVSSGEGVAESARIPFTPRAKSVLERACEEAMRRGHHDVGTEHILLALAGVDEGEGMNALRALGVDATQIRDVVLQILAGPRAAGTVRWRRLRCPPRRERRSVDDERIRPGA